MMSSMFLMRASMDVPNVFVWTVKFIAIGSSAEKPQQDQ